MHEFMQFFSLRFFSCKYEQYENPEKLDVIWYEFGFYKNKKSVLQLSPITFEKLQFNLIENSIESEL